MMIPVVLFLLVSTCGCLAEDLRMEPEYSRASSMRSEPSYASASEMSPYPQQIDLDTLKKMPVVIIHPRKPIKLKMIQGENMHDLYKTLTSGRLLGLLKSAASSYSEETNPTPKKTSMREAKSLNFGSSQARSVFSHPFGDHQRFLPSSSNLFSRPFLPHQTGGGWPQRVKNSFSNMFSFAKPFSGMADTNRPVFMPSHQPGFHIPGAYGSFHHQHNSHPGMWNQFQPTHSLGSSDFSTAASFAHPAKLQLGSYFNPYHHSPMHQQQFGGDLAMSGAAMIPHRVVPPPNHAFAHYVSTVPRHKPLFNNIKGLKAASYDIRNAFADFTESDEHGPEVSQKFGSVGHVMNKFLDMMGLGAAGGITDDGDGNFGGAGNWASMDSTPISRSLDFYPGYGNQAHLDDIEDFPIFLEDITERFLTKMNLTHLLKNETKTPLYKDASSSDSKKEATNSKSSSEDKEKSKDSSKMKEKFVTKDKMAKPDAPTRPDKDLPKSSDYLYVPAHTLEMMQKKGSTPKQAAAAFDTKKGVSSDATKVSNSDPGAPVVNYQVPPSLSTVAPQDRIPPVVVFSSFPSKSNNDPAPAPPSYSQAMPLPQHEFEDNPNKLVDEDDLRPWVPVTNGRGYVEKRPRPFVDITKASDQPRSLKIVEQVLSSSTSSYQ